MITKDKLKEYVLLGTELKCIERRLEELESEVYSVRNVTYSLASDNKSKKASGADFSALLVKLLDLKELYERKWDKLIDARAEIESAVEALPLELRIIIRTKYLDGQTWEQVAEEVGYSLRQVYRIVKAAGF